MIAPDWRPSTLDRKALEAHGFGADDHKRLRAAILIDDDVDPDARLPAMIPLDHGRETLVACFRLSRSLWYAAFDRRRLRDLADRLVRDCDLDPADRHELQHCRAIFGHFRNAHALYGATHQYPMMLNHVTVTMGHVQDGIRSHRAAFVRRKARRLRILLGGLPARFLVREADHIQFTTAAAFRKLLENDMAVIAQLVTRQEVTRSQFHAARNVVLRQLSFWNTLRTIAPAQDLHDMSRCLSAISGLLSDLHDGLVERQGDDPHAYGLGFSLPEPVSRRASELAEAYCANLFQGLAPGRSSG